MAYLKEIIQLFELQQEPNSINLEALNELITQHNTQPREPNPEDLSEIKNIIDSLLSSQGQDIEREHYGCEATHIDKIIIALLQLNDLKNDMDFIAKIHYQSYEYLNLPIYQSTNKLLYDYWGDSVTYAEEELIVQDSSVPKIFNVIWLGNTLPEDLTHNLSKLLPVAQKNNFEIRLWTDNPSKQEAIFNHLPNAAKQYVNLVDIQTLYPQMQQDLGMEKANIMESFINQEMSGFHNFAAASDLLRILILKQHGGIYLDLDIELAFNPKEQNENTTIGQFENELGFKQLIRKVSLQYGFGELYSSRNDMLQSAKNHPILDKALELWLLHYQTQQIGTLPHQYKDKTGFFPSATDQRRYGQSHYEKKGEFSFVKKLKELQTGNLGVAPIEIARQVFLQQYNQQHNKTLEVDDIMFGYDSKLVHDGLGEDHIHCGDLLFEHKLAHSWLNDKKKRRPNEI